MNLLGNKVQAREVARKLGIPVVPGSEGAVDIPTARQLINEIGLPIMSMNSMKRRTMNRKNGSDK